MIVEAMRMMLPIDQNRVIEVMENTTVKEGFNDCFSVAMKELIPIFQTVTMYDKKSISDLTVEEEAMLLTNSYNKKVFVKVINNKSKKNHISLTAFEDSMEIPVALLVTPKYRETLFYSTEAEDLDEDMGVELEAKEKLLADTTDSSKNEAPLFTLDVPKLDKFAMTLDKNDLVSNLMADQNHEMRKESYRNLGMSENIIDVYLSSVMSRMMDRSEPEKLSFIKLYYMSFTEFRAIAFFFHSSKDFSKMITAEKLTIWNQMYDSLPKLICHLYWKFDNINGRDMISLTNDFYSTLDGLKDLNSNIMKNMYDMLRFRILNYFVLMRYSAHLNCYKLDNRERFMCLVDRTDDFNEVENMRLKMETNPDLYTNPSKVLNAGKDFENFYKSMTALSNVKEMSLKEKEALMTETNMSFKETLIWNNTILDSLIDN